MMTNEYLLDRETETKMIVDDIDESKNTVLQIVYSKTAVGKSAFTNKVISKIDKDNGKVICIRTLPENIGSQYLEWENFDLLFDKISTLSIEDEAIIPFQKYIVSNEIIKKMNLEDTYQNIKRKNFFWTIIKGWFKKELAIDAYNAFNYSTDDSLKSKIIKKQYMKYFFLNNRIFLIIDNIQNIDRSSLMHILQIITETKHLNHHIILEYTLTKKNNKEKMFDLIKYIQSYGLVTKELNLTKLPNEYIVDFVNYHIKKKPSSYEFNIKLLDYYDSLLEGNLQQVLSFANNYDKLDKQYIEIKDETYKTIKNLNYRSSKCLLSLVLQNNGKVSKNVVNEVFSALELNELENAENELIEYKIININEEYYILKHASIKDSWIDSHDKEFDNIDIIIRNALEDIYMEMLQNTDYLKIDLVNIPWLALLEIYKRKYPEKIYSLINYLKEGVLKNVSPKTAWYFLEAFIEKTQDKIDEYKNCYYDILNVCFEFELYQEGMECIMKMQNIYSLASERKLLLYKMLFFSALDEHEKNVEYFNMYCTFFQENTREYLNLLIIVQASYRGLNMLKECLQIFDKLYKNKTYMKFNEYGYFLRITNMYKSRKESLKYLKKSCTFFRKKGLIHQEGKSAISYGHTLASLGKLDKAKYYIDLAETLLADKQMGCHMIYVNKAAIMLHNNIFSDDVWNYLEIADSSTYVTFDKLAVQINKLAWCLGNEKYDICDNIISETIELCDIEPDKSVVIMAYYNLYVYYSRINDVYNCNKYRELANELTSWSESIKLRLNNQTLKKYEFILSKPWTICFLEYWTFDLLYEN